MTRKFILAAIATLAMAAVGSTATAGTRVTGGGEGASTQGTRVTGTNPDGSIFGTDGSIFSIFGYGCIFGLPC